MHDRSFPCPASNMPTHAKDCKCGFVSGLTWIRIHALRRWLQKMIDDGPEPIIGMSPDVGAKLAAKRHGERIDRMRSKIDALIGGAA